LNYIPAKKNYLKKVLGPTFLLIWHGFGHVIKKNNFLKKIPKNKIKIGKISIFFNLKIIY